MSIRESIGKLPIWKAFIIILLMLTFTIAGIEELIVTPIFHLLDRTITHFDKLFKDEADDVDRDFQQFNEKDEYDKADSALISFKMEKQRADVSFQDYVCADVLINKKLEKFYDLAYVKHHELERNFITQQINSNKKFINERIAKGDFDPSKCKDAR